jgi:hypothetical protein
MLAPCGMNWLNTTPYTCGTHKNGSNQPPATATNHRR